MDGAKFQRLVESRFPGIARHFRRWPDFGWSENSNKQADLLRQSIYSRLAGYGRLAEDLGYWG